jgi:hypothetical protein
MMTEAPPGHERRMVVQKLDLWRRARGEEPHLPLKTALENDFVEIAPSSFVLEVAGGNVEPAFVSIGAAVCDSRGQGLVGRPISSADPESLLGHALQSLNNVLNKKVPATTSGTYNNASGKKISYRCILLPLGAASENVGFVLGAISFKTD